MTRNPPKIQCLESFFVMQWTNTIKNILYIPVADWMNFYFSKVTTRAMPCGVWCRYKAESTLSSVSWRSNIRRLASLHSSKDLFKCCSSIFCGVSCCCKVINDWNGVCGNSLVAADYCDVMLRVLWIFLLTLCYFVKNSYINRYLLLSRGCHVLYETAVPLPAHDWHGKLFSEKGSPYFTEPI